MIEITLGETTANEANTMLTASAESGSEIAEAILDKQRGRTFKLTHDEAIYLRDNLLGDADRVAQGVSAAAGRAFENAGIKLGEIIEERGQ